MSHMDLAAALEDPRRSKALVSWNNNPAASSPEQGRLRKALEREDLFHVAVDLFHTDTTAYADIVLPAASFLEFNDLVLPYFDLTLSAQVKTCEPPGRALPNQEIFRRLARAMGYNDPGLFESEADLIDRLLKQTTYEGNFADLAKVGTTSCSPSPSCSLPISNSRHRQADRACERPGGRAGAAARASRSRRRADEARAVAHHLAGIALANELELRQRPGHTEAARAGYRHAPSRRCRCPRLRRGRQPSSLVNEAGRLPLAVTISRRRSLASALSIKDGGRVHRRAMPTSSVLVAGRKSDMAESTTVHSTVVRLERAETPAQP